jgi:hypothetical protein
MVVKMFETYVSLGNLGLSLKKVHCFPKKLHFPLENLGPSVGIIHFLSQGSYFCP